MGKLDLHLFTPAFAGVSVRYYTGIMKSCQRLRFYVYVSNVYVSTRGNFYFALIRLHFYDDQSHSFYLRVGRNLRKSPSRIVVPFASRCSRKAKAYFLDV